MELGAKEGARRVREVIYGQEYGWEPLSDRWEAYKESHGLDPRVYIATGEAVRKIRAWQDRTGTWHYGARPGSTHNSGLPLSTLFRVLEYGSEAANIPPRPVWRPVWRELVKKNGYLRRVAANLGDQAAKAAQKEAQGRKKSKQYK